MPGMLNHMGSHTHTVKLDVEASCKVKALPISLNRHELETLFKAHISGGSFGPGCWASPHLTTWQSKPWDCGCNAAGPCSQPTSFHPRVSVVAWVHSMSCRMCKKRLGQTSWKQASRSSTLPYLRSIWRVQAFGARASLLRLGQSAGVSHTQWRGLLGIKQTP